jgi:uncharacterized repeat protein (TIGR01451 family)
LPDTTRPGRDIVIGTQPETEDGLGGEQDTDETDWHGRTEETLPSEDIQEEDIQETDENPEIPETGGVQETEGTDETPGLQEPDDTSLGDENPGSHEDAGTGKDTGNSDGAGESDVVGGKADNYVQSAVGGTGARRRVVGHAPPVTLPAGPGVKDAQAQGGGDRQGGAESGVSLGESPDDGALSDGSAASGDGVTDSEAPTDIGTAAADTIPTYVSPTGRSAIGVSAQSAGAADGGGEGQGDGDLDQGPDAVSISAKASADAGFAIGAGEVLSYEITVRNDGAEAIEDLRVRDYLPSHTSFVGADGSYGVIGGEQHVTWNIPSLAPGEERVLTLNVRVFTCIPEGFAVTNSVRWQVSDRTPTNDPRDPVGTVYAAPVAVQ